MKRQSTIIRIVLTMATLGVSVAFGAPRLVCEGPVYDFGSRYDSEKMEHTFIIRNEGDQSVELRTKTDCGCLANELSRKTLAPGEDATVKASVRLSGLRGVIRKQVMVLPSMGAPLPLSMVGAVKRSIEVLPERLDLGEIRPGEATTANIFVVVDQKRPVKLTGVVSTSRKVQACIVSLADPGLYRVTVLVTPSGLEADIEEAVEFTIDDPTTPVIRVPINAAVHGSLAVVPDELVLVAGQTTAAPQYIVVRPGTVKSFRIRNVNVPSGSIQAEAQEMGEGAYRIKISGLTADRVLDGQQIVLRTDLITYPEIKIPIIVREHPANHAATTKPTDAAPRR